MRELAWVSTVPKVRPVTSVAVTFLWLGMVLAISFLEAPLKFRAPGVTVPIGLGIGRLVFRGASTMNGYFGKPEATAAVTLVGGWIDSGDLAYRADGELYIAGRRKDLIIKAGQLMGHLGAVVDIADKGPFKGDSPPGRTTLQCEPWPAQRTKRSGEMR